MPQMQNSSGNQNQQAGQMPQMQGNSQASSQYSPTTSMDESLPVEELVQRMTYEQAAQVVITGNGKFGGKTMGQVAVESPKESGVVRTELFWQEPSDPGCSQSPFKCGYANGWLDRGMIPFQKTVISVIPGSFYLTSTYSIRIILSVESRFRGSGML